MIYIGSLGLLNIQKVVKSLTELEFEGFSSRSRTRIIAQNKRHRNVFDALKERSGCTGISKPLFMEDT